MISSAENLARRSSSAELFRSSKGEIRIVAPVEGTTIKAIPNFFLQKKITTLDDLDALSVGGPSPGLAEDIQKAVLGPDLSKLVSLYLLGDLEKCYEWIIECNITIESIELNYPMTEEALLKPAIKEKVVILAEKEARETNEKFSSETIQEIEFKILGLIPSKDWFRKLVFNSTAMRVNRAVKDIIITHVELKIPEAPHIGTYEEVTKRLKRDELGAIESYCDRNKLGLEELAHKIINTFQFGSIKEIEQLINLTDKKLLFMAAFHGFREGFLNFDTLNRVSEILSIQNRDLMTFDPLYSDGTFDPDVQDFLRMGLQGFLTEDQQVEFFEIVKGLPREQRLIFAFYTDQRFIDYDVVLNLGTRVYELPIGEVIVNKQKFNLLNMLSFENLVVKTLVSNQLRQFVFKAQFPDSFATINPVFGISTPSQIKTNGLTRTRDLALHYAKVGSEGELEIADLDSADGFMCIENDFEMHDLYHGWVTSGVPVHLKRLSIEISDFTTRLAVDNREKIGEKNYRALRKAAWDLKDMDYLYYAAKKMGEIDKDFVPLSLINGLYFDVEFSSAEKDTAYIFIILASQLINQYKFEHDNKNIALIPAQETQEPATDRAKINLTENHKPFESLEGLFGYFNLILEEFSSKLENSPDFIPKVKKIVYNYVCLLTYPIRESVIKLQKSEIWDSLPSYIKIISNYELMFANEIEKIASK